MAPRHAAAVTPTTTDQRRDTAREDGAIGAMSSMHVSDGMANHAAMSAHMAWSDARPATDTDSERAATNVGREWDYRSYISKPVTIEALEATLAELFAAKPATATTAGASAAPQAPGVNGAAAPLAAHSRPLTHAEAPARSGIHGQK